MGIFEDKLKKDLSCLSVLNTRKFLKDSVKSFSNFVFKTVNSEIKPEKTTMGDKFYKYKNILYEGFTLSPWSGVTRDIDNYSFHVKSTFSLGRIILTISPGITISLAESEDGEFEVELKFSKKREFYFSMEQVIRRKGYINTFTAGPFSLTVHNTNNGSVVVLSRQKGIVFDIVLSVFLVHNENFCLIKELGDIKDCSVEKEKKDKATQKVTLKRFEPISLEVGLDLLCLIDPSLNPNPLMDKMVIFKDRLRDDFIFPLPGIIYKDNLKLKPSEYVIKINEYIVGKGEAFPQLILILGFEEELKRFKGITASNDFVYGLKGMWLEREYGPIVERDEFLIMDTLEVVCCHVQQVIYNNMHKIFGFQETEELLDLFTNKYAKEVSLIRMRLDLPQICRIFRSLIRDRIPLAYTGVILTALEKITHFERNAVDIYELVRKEIIPVIGPLFLYRDSSLIECEKLSTSLEKEIRSYSIKTELGYETNLPYDVRKRIYGRAIKILHKDRKKRSLFLICSPEVRPLFSMILQEDFPQIRIFSREEISENLFLSIRGEFSI